ncbi:penicillin-binding transpeptidase domain-containing protein, partial [Streptococcus loxodontisalivarius]
FANGGTYYEPMYINKVEFSDGTSQDFSATSTQAMSETTAYMMTDMMKTVLTSGTGTYAAVSGAPYNAGKTGTSNYSDDELAQIEAETGIYSSSVGTMAPDETFVGYTTQYAMAVWTGYSNRLTPIYGDNLNIAAEVYSQMSGYLNTMYGSGSTDWTMPDGVYRSGSYVYLGSARSSSSSRNSSYYSYSSSETTEESSSEETSSSYQESSSEESSSSQSSSSNSNSESDTDNSSSTDSAA